jgi:hypothetical protein
MRTALTGWFTDEGEVLSIWRTSSPAVRAAVREYYADFYEDGSLDGAIRDQLEGNDLTEIEALDRREEDPVGAAIATLNNSISIWNDDEAQIEQTLRDLDDAQREELMERMPPQDRMRIQRALGGEDLEVYNALMEGNTVEAAAIRLDEAMGSSGSALNPANWFANQQDAVSALESTDVGGEDNRERRAEIIAAFNERMTNQGAETTFEDELRGQFEGADSQAVNLTARGDDVGSQAAQLRASGEVWTGTDNDTMFQLIEQNHGDEGAMEARFEELYGETVSDYARDEMNDLDFQRAEQLRENGRMDPAFALQYAFESSLGTDEAAALEVLQRHSPEEIREIAQEYEQLTGTPLHQSLGSEYGHDGGDRHEIDMAIRYGNTQDQDRLIQRQREEYDFRRGDDNSVSRGAMDVADFIGYSTAGSDLDRNQERMNASVDEEGNVTNQEDLSLALTGGVAENRRYDSERDSVAEGAATGAEIVAATIATIASEGAASPWLIAAIGGAAGIGARAAVGGNDYGTEDFTLDTAQVALQALTAGLGSGVLDPRIAQALESQPAFLRVVAQQAARGAAGGVAGAILDEDALREGGVEYVINLLESGAAGGAGGAVNAAASETVGRALGNVGGRTMAGAAARNAASSAVGGAAQTIVMAGEDGVNPDQLVSGALGDALSGAAEGARDYHVAAARLARRDTEEGRTRSAAELDAEGLSAEQIAEYQQRMRGPEEAPAIPATEPVAPAAPAAPAESAEPQVAPGMHDELSAMSDPSILQSGALQSDSNTESSPMLSFTPEEELMLAIGIPEEIAIVNAQVEARRQSMGLGATQPHDHLPPQLQNLLNSGNPEDVELALRNPGVRDSLRNHAGTPEQVQREAERIVAGLGNDPDRALSYFPQGPMREAIERLQGASGGSDGQSGHAAEAEAFMERLNAGDMSQIRGVMEDGFTDQGTYNGQPHEQQSHYEAQISSFARIEGDEIIIDIPYHLQPGSSEVPYHQTSTGGASPEQMAGLADEAQRGMDFINARTAEVQTADGERRRIRFNPVYIADPTAAAALNQQTPGTCHIINAHQPGGAEGFDAGNWFAESQTRRPTEREYVLAHELLHNSLGLSDNYDGTSQPYGPNVDITRRVHQRSDPEALHYIEDNSIMSSFGGQTASGQSGEVQMGRRHELQALDMAQRALYETGPAGAPPLDQSFQPGDGGNADFYARADRVRQALAQRYNAGDSRARTGERIADLDRLIQSQQRGEMTQNDLMQQLEAMENQFPSQ